MIPVKHIDPDDLALYAMQLLPPDEMAEMSLHLQHSAEARRVLSEFYGDLAHFALTAEMHSPPALARQRLMKHVAREKKAIPAHLLPQQEASTYTPRPVLAFEDAPKKSVIARTLPWLGWALAAGLAVAFVNLHQQEEHLRTVAMQDHTSLTQSAQAAQVSEDLAATLMDTVKDPSAVHVVLTSTGIHPPPEGRASYIADKGSLIFLASNLAPLAPARTYELWVIPSDGHDAIPAGTFKPDANGNASVVLPPIPKGINARTFGVTIEYDEGSNQPTLPIILKGTAS